MNATTEVQASELTKALESSGLAESGQADLRQVFGPSFVEVRRLLDESSAIIVTDATQVTEINAARAARLKIKKARVSVEALRKSTKDEALRFGQSVDKVAKMITAQCEIEERRLEEAETFAERAEATRKNAIESARRLALAPLVPDVSIYPLRDMTEAAWGQLLSGMEAAKKARDDAAAKVEADRLAAVEAKRVEDARVREENARLAREKAEQEATAKAEREKAAAELKAAQDKARAEADAARKEREEIEAKARAEREAADKAAREEKARADAELAKVKAAADAERARAQAELRAANEAREKTEREAEEKREAAKRDAELAAAAPDADKLAAFTKAVMDIPLPEMTTDKGRKAGVLAKSARGRLFRDLLEITDALRV